MDEAGGRCVSDDGRWRGPAADDDDDDANGGSAAGEAEGGAED